MEVQKRQYDMDWIKVLATAAVFFYHCSMFFNPFPWHVKNNQIDSGSILVFSLFVGSWIMPIFFAVSGISTFYALRKRGIGQFVQERLTRLGVPLLFGIFILSPPQVYIERITHHQFKGSFLEFLPHYFDGLYLDIGGTGNFSFVGLHLWYLFVLLIFSFLTLLLFIKVKRKNKFGTVHFIAMPALLFLAGFIHTIGLGGWDILFYLLIFIYGYYFFSSEGFKDALHKSIKLHTVMALCTTVFYILWFMNGTPSSGSFSDVLFYAVHVLNGWSLLMCIFYLADKFLSKSNRFLKYGSEAAMPFYVLHQPILVMVGYWIHDWQWPVYLKLLFLASISLTIILLSYHFVIRNINILRFLFGQKAKGSVNQSSGSKAALK